MKAFIVPGNPVTSPPLGQSSNYPSPQFLQLWGSPFYQIVTPNQVSLQMLSRAAATVPPQGSTLHVCSSHRDMASPGAGESVIQRIQQVLYLQVCLLNRGKTVTFNILNKQN